MLLVVVVADVGVMTAGFTTIAAAATEEEMERVYVNKLFLYFIVLQVLQYMLWCSQRLFLVLILTYSHCTPCDSACFVVAFVVEDEDEEDSSELADVLNEAQPCMYGNRRTSEGII